MNTEGELLARYVLEGSEPAFAEVVRARAGFVYSAALRRANGNAHLANDITQQVFIALARSARQLSDHPTLSGWLFVTTRNVAVQMVRAESRRRKREKESAIMQETDPNLPVASENKCFLENLDAVLDALNPRDRDALLLRFFEGRSFIEIATTSGLTENAARMRVERALEKLRAFFARKGLTSTAATLSASLAAQASMELPAPLLTSMAHVAVANAGIGTSVWTLTLMSMTKLQTGAAIAVVALGVGGIVYHQRSIAELNRKIDQLNAQVETATALREENLRLKHNTRTTDPAGKVQDNPSDRPGRSSTAPEPETARSLAKRNPVSLAPGLIPVEALVHSNRSTARDAFSTQIWAAALGDVDLEQSSIALTPEARSKLDAALAGLPEATRNNYRTPERLMASVLAGSPHPVGGMQILSEKSLSENGVVLETQWQHSDDSVVHHSNVQLQRDDSGNWRMVVPMILVDRAIAYLQGNSVGQTSPGKN